MHEWMSGWDWAWMTFMMVFWIALLGACLRRGASGQRPPLRVS
jgi:hypothetical protein